MEMLVIFRWSAPRVLLTDNGTEFRNKNLEELTESYGIVHSTVLLYHP